MNDFFTTDPIWAIEPAAIERIYSLAKELSVIDPAARVQIVDDSDYEPSLYVRKGVAVIPVTGTIVPRVRYTWSSQMSLARLRADIAAAIGDPRVRGIVLDIDSPGGAVTGISEAAHAIAEQAEEKPIVAYGAGQITSGAAWLAAACDRTIVSSTSRAGSIGVLAVHVDFSKLDERMGVKYTHLTAGKYKAIGNEDEPLSDEARQIIEGHLGQIYDVFISDIALFRGATEEVVRRDMADGKVFIGDQAVEVGLADQTGNLDDAIEAAAILAMRRGNQPNTRSLTMNWKISDIKSTDDLKAAMPVLAGELEQSARAEGEVAGAASVDAAVIRNEAQLAESERLMGLVKAHFGDEAHEKFAKVVGQGFSAEQYTALLEAIGAKAPGAQVPQAGGDAGGDAAGDAAFKKQLLDGISGASAGDPGAGDGTGQGPQSWDEAVSAIMTEDKCSRTAAIKKAYAQYPALHQAYIKAVNERKTG